MTDGYREFEFDLPGALFQNLVSILDSMAPAPLTTEALSGVPEAQGVYQLFLDGDLVYVGKTDAEAGLFKRLARHSRKTMHRHSLSPERVAFKAVRIFVFTAMDLETQLIKHYKDDGAATIWNGSGFGANDPGRKRDTSAPGRFDSEYPIDYDRPLGEDFTGTSTAAEVAARLKSVLPYTFRFQLAARRGRAPHPELAETNVTISGSSVTARSVLRELTEQLPAGWQATALSALLILYKERVENYPGATVIARS